MAAAPRTVDVDYLVIGAGASGMAFADALLDHSATDTTDTTVALVDRRDGVGGHWRGAYPFVQLHQASPFYGVASTVLGGDLQSSGPEAGLFERAGQAEITGYYEDLLASRMAGRVELFTGCDYRDDRSFVAATGERYVVPDRTRVVDARYLAPEIPAETPPRFAVEAGVRVVPVNALPEVEDAPSQYVVVGSGKTATDAIVWLLGRGIDPGAICWVRPRDPWMLDRAVVQPDPAVFLGMAASVMEAGASSDSLDDAFLRLEDAGVMMRLDPAVTPTMAKAPTLGRWELDLLRTVTDVVRHGRIVAVERGRLHLADRSVRIADDALVVNCAADGLKNPPRVPIWQPEAITLQPVRAGFPCFGAALTGYVEATRADDTAKNAVCAPSSYGNSLEQWAAMNVIGTRNAAAFGAEPDIAAWAASVALNPARVAPDHPGSTALDDARERLARWTGPGVARLARLAGLS